jgi:arylsulfatase
MNDEVFKFVATFKDFPPRAFPPSFNPANMMESTISDLKDARRRTTTGAAK